MNLKRKARYLRKLQRREMMNRPIFRFIIEDAKDTGDEVHLDPIETLIALGGKRIGGVARIEIPKSQMMYPEMLNKTMRIEYYEK